MFYFERTIGIFISCPAEEPEEVSQSKLLRWESNSHWCQLSVWNLASQNALLSSLLTPAGQNVLLQTERVTCWNFLFISTVLWRQEDKYSSMVHLLAFVSFFWRPCSLVERSGRSFFSFFKERCFEFNVKMLKTLLICRSVDRELKLNH